VLLLDRSRFRTFVACLRIAMARLLKVQLQSTVSAFSLDRARLAPLPSQAAVSGRVTPGEEAHFLTASPWYRG
jgi:hypothetical protein